MKVFWEARRGNALSCMPMTTVVPMSDGSIVFHERSVVTDWRPICATAEPVEIAAIVTYPTAQRADIDPK